MQRNRRHRGLWILTLSVAAGIGCDSASNRADREVTRLLAEARQAADEARPADQQRLLREAMETATESPSAQAHAQSALGQASLEEARALNAQAEQQSLELDRQLVQLARLKTQVETGANLAEGYSRRDPAEAIAYCNRLIAEAQGGPDRPAWFEHDGSVIPTLAAIRQDVARLQGEITALEEKLKQAQEQRRQVAQLAESAVEQSKTLSGQGAVTVFRQAADLRKQAGTLLVDIDRLEDALQPLRSQLAIAQGQQSAVEMVVANLKSEIDQLQQGWGAMQEKAAAQRDLTRQIAAAETQDASSLAARGTAVAEMATALAATRGAARGKYIEAIDLLSRAGRAADQLRTELQSKITDPKFQDSPQRQAWQAASEVMHPAHFRLREAQARRMLGEMLTAEVASLARQDSLFKAAGSAVASSGAAVPAALSGADSAAVSAAAIELAREQFAEADRVLEGITEGQAPQDVADAARVERVFSLHAFAAMERAAGDPAQADARLEAARQQRDLAVERNLRLPALPVALGPPRAPAATGQDAPQ